MRKLQPDISVTEFLKAQKGLRYFQLLDASVIDWRQAEKGAYYYLCDLSHKLHDDKSIYSISTFMIVKVIDITRVQDHIHGLTLMALHEDGRQEPIIISEDLIAHYDAVLWPLKLLEVRRFKGKVRESIMGKIVEQLDAVDSF